MPDELFVIEDLFPDHPCDVCGARPSMFTVRSQTSDVSDVSPQEPAYFCNAHLGWAYRMEQPVMSRDPEPDPARDVLARHDEVALPSQVPLPFAAPDLRDPDLGDGVPNVQQPHGEFTVIHVSETKAPVSGPSPDRGSVSMSTHARKSPPAGRTIQVRSERGSLVHLDAAEVAHLVSTDRAEKTRIVFKSEPNAPVIEFVAAEDLSTVSSKLAEALEIAPDQVPIGQPDKRATEHELSERRREWLQAQLARSHGSDVSLALRSRYALRQIGLWLHGTKPISAQALQEMAQALSAVAPADLVDEL